MRELHFFETSNDHHKKGNVLNKICVWQHRGFVMGCLPDISQSQPGSTTQDFGVDRPFQMLENESNG